MLLSGWLFSHSVLLISKIIFLAWFNLTSISARIKIFCTALFNVHGLWNITGSSFCSNKLKRTDYNYFLKQNTATTQADSWRDASPLWYGGMEFLQNSDEDDIGSNTNEHVILE